MQDISLLSKVVFSLEASSHSDFIEFDSPYEKCEKRKEELENEWKELSKEEKEKTTFKRFITCGMQGFILTDGMLNFKRLNEEVKARLDAEHPSRFLGIEIIDGNKSLLDLLEGYENISAIKKLYKTFNKTLGTTKNAGIDSVEAGNIKYCMRQGRELYLAGNLGSYVVKPLNYFYSITAYSYAMILLSSPLRFKLSSIPNSHGIDHKLDYARISFGGGIRKGTFSELFTAFPVEFFKSETRVDEYIDITLDRSQSVKNFWEHSWSTSLFALFSMIPEMRDIYSEQDTCSLVHPLEIKYAQKQRKHGFEFIIGNGSDLPDVSRIQKCFPQLDMKNVDGKKSIFVESEKMPFIPITIYTDIHGKLWYIDNKFELINMPEICIHFLIISALSNIMRYQPEVWGAILNNDLDARLSTLIRYYLTIYEQKFPFLILRSISNYYPIIRERK